MPTNPAIVPAARLAWRDDQPVSLEFGDIYHAVDGVAEVERVFLVPNRFDARATAGDDWLRIGELGFGSGLNFVTAAERFLAQAPAHTRLHFVSVEAKPIDQEAFARLAARRARTQPLYRALARAYPPRLPGWHRRALGGGRVVLSLYLGDAAAGLADIAGRALPIDAWFLDGFAPDRNPAMWDERVLAAVAALSAPGTTAATFTAAGRVRRGLEAHGFAVERLDQRPHKRHTLVARFEGTTRRRPASARRVAVVGTGLAGAFTARALADAGMDVIALDDGAVPRLSDAVLHGRVLGDGSVRARLRNNAYLDAAAAYRALGCACTGALQFPSTTIGAGRLDRLATIFAGTGPWLRRVDAVSASALAGLPLDAPALHFADAARVPVDAVCQTLLEHVRIETVRAHASGWRQSDRGALAIDGAVVHADAAVLCTGLAPDWPALRFLEILPVWGQFERARLRHAPRLPLLGEGYAAPCDDGTVVVGATYEQRPWTPERASAFNRARFERTWQGVSRRPSDARWTGFQRGRRGVSSDRLPVVGSVEAGLVVNLAHGSHGTATAPLAAACVVEMLGGDFAPIERDGLALLDPGRFRARQARRGPRHGAS